MNFFTFVLAHDLLPPSLTTYHKHDGLGCSCFLFQIFSMQTWKSLNWIKLPEHHNIHMAFKVCDEYNVAIILFFLFAFPFSGVGNMRYIIGFQQYQNSCKQKNMGNEPHSHGVWRESSWIIDLLVAFVNTCPNT